ncbi:MAG: hypothetical protein AB1750_10125, partial [Chloroflexota bacterium]
MQNDTSQKMNWKTSLLMMCISIIGMAIFFGARIALAMSIVMGVMIGSALLAKWTATKTGKPIYSAVIALIGLALAMGGMKWFLSDDHTIWMLLKEVRDILLMIGIPGVIGLILYGLTKYWKKHNPSTSPPPAKKDIPQLESDFLKWYQRGAGLLFIGWIIFGFGSYFLLKAFGSWYYSHLIHGVIVEPADSALWALVALLLGVYISFGVVNLLTKKQLGDDYERQQS